MIRLLQESMPGVEIETVALDENIQHPLDAVLAQVDRGKTGPVMILGLEKSSPSSAKERPILYALNMSRPEWAKALLRPLVFWVPEYLLGLMGREAPDFLDWRSDTLFFPEQGGQDLLPFESGIWRGGLDERMPENQRRARIAELQARLATHVQNDDPLAIAARADWLGEMGNHLSLLGDLEHAETVHREALQAVGRLDPPQPGFHGSLAAVLSRRGRIEEALRELHEELAVQTKINDPPGLARAYSGLAGLYLAQGQLDEAEVAGRQAALIAERHDLPEETAQSYGRLAQVASNRGDLDAAESNLRKAWQIFQEVGARSSEGEALQNLALLQLQKGDLAQAEALLKNANTIFDGLGDVEGLANVQVALGFIHWLRSDNLKARERWFAARALFERLQLPHRIAQVDSYLEILESPPDKLSPP